MAQNVDQARHAVGETVDQTEGFGFDQIGLRAGHPQTVAHVFHGLVVIEFVEVPALGDALIELAQIVARQNAVQFGLTDQHHLQQFLCGGFQIGQQSKLLEHHRVQILGLVHDDDGATTSRTIAFQKGRQVFGEFLAAGAARGQAELGVDGLQKLGGGEHRVHDGSHGDVFGVFGEQSADQRGLARADFAGDGDEPAALADPVHEMRERLAMLGAHEQVAGVGGQAKRKIAEPKESLIHEECRSIP